MSTPAEAIAALIQAELDLWSALPGPHPLPAPEFLGGPRDRGRARLRACARAAGISVRPYERALSRAVHANMGLVYKFSHKFRVKAFSRGIDLEEIIQEGSIGLHRALESYNPEVAAFSTYGSWWILQTIDRYIMNHDQIHIPVHYQVKSKGSTALQEDISQLRKIRSLAEPASGATELTLEETLECPRALADEALMVRVDAHLMSKAMESLPQKEHYAVEQRLVHDRTLQEIATEIGLTRERVRQLVLSGLERIRKYTRRYQVDFNG